MGLGCMSVSGQYSNGVPLPQAEATSFFRGVYDAGCRSFDTAEVYKSGPLSAPATPSTVFNETQLGKFFATVPRESFTVATKYMPLLRGGKCDYESVRLALLASLKRLGLEYVDLYYSHVVLTREAGIEFMASAKRLVEEGLLRHVGLSEVSAAWLREAHAVHPVCCIQQEWSLLTRNVEDHLVPTCRELNIGIVAYSPLARNLLSAPKTRPDDVRRAGIPRFSPENFAKNAKMLEQLEALASKKGVSPAQLSLAWLVQKAVDLGVAVLPIPGTARLQHALDNIASMRVALQPADMAFLEEIAKQTAGERESKGYINMRIEGQEQRARLLREAASSPAAAAEAITLHAEGVRSWPKASQDNLLETLKAEGGVQKIIAGLVAFHASTEDDDGSRVFPGVPVKHQDETRKALAASDFARRVRAQFSEVNFNTSTLQRVRSDTFGALQESEGEPARFRRACQCFARCCRRRGTPLLQ